MKFIKCMYISFKNSVLKVQWKKGDIILLTNKLATSQVIMDGINTRNFVFVDVNTPAALSKVVNVTPAITKEFKKRMVAEEEARMEAAKAAAEAAKPLAHPVAEDKGVIPTPPPEPEPKPEPDPPKEEEKKVPEDTPQEDGETEEKAPEGDGDSAEDQAEKPKEEEKVLAFTEDAGNVGAAVEAVEKETDIEKLKHALKEDERVTVTKAIEARLEELGGE